MALRSRKQPIMRGRVHPRLAQLALADPFLVGTVSRNSMKRLGERKRSDRDMGPENWQARAYDLVFELVGELAYVVNLKAATISRGSLEVVEWDPDTGEQVAEEESDHPEVWAAARANLRKLRGESGDYHALLREWSIHDQVAGEGHLVGEPIADTNQIAWEMLSVLEVRSSGSGYTRFESSKKSRNTTERSLGSDVFVVRYHRRDPRHSDDALSMIKRVLGIAEQIARLDALIDVMISGRMPADMLLMPAEVQFTDDDDEYRDQDDEAISHDDPFDEALAAHVDAPRMDPNNPAAYTPFVAKLPGEYIDKVRLQPLSTDRHSWAIELRAKNVDRMGTELDIPPEIISGKGGLNDWSAFNVDQDFIIKHVVEDGQRGAQFFSTGFLRKFLMAEDGVSPEVAARFEYEYDASTLVARQDETVNARALWDRQLLTDEAMMRASGFNPDVDQPTRQDLIERAFFKMIGGAPVSALNTGIFDRVAEAYGIALDRDRSNADADADAEAASAGEAEVGDETAGEENENVDGNSSVDQPERNTERQFEAARVHAHVVAAQQRALGRARNKIIGRAEKVAGLRERIGDAIPKLDADEFRALELSPAQLMDGEYVALEHALTAIYAEGAESRGIDPWDAQELGRIRAVALCDALMARTVRDVRDGRTSPISIDWVTATQESSR